jgi:hypothetical protein
MIEQLTEEAYLSTMQSGMENVTEDVLPVMDIWPELVPLIESGVVDSYVADKELVEYVYRSKDGKYDHVILPTSKKNNFVVVIVEITGKKIKGYFKLDIGELYGIKD